MTVLLRILKRNIYLFPNTEKTVVMLQPPPKTAYNIRCINVKGSLLQAIDCFTNLGINLSLSSKAQDEFAHGISNVSQAFATCRKSSGIVRVSPLSTKFKM
ncbi:unnamed protein product [Schistocephalus solidus]|uniref:Uncharacterized protein n=1 Tax=Schistocephalus solidus TaxID=70667 RepID=A0A183TGY4_SCHSO|nr:unnamed protein product [Schistocephalus solidus]